VIDYILIEASFDSERTTSPNCEARLGKGSHHEM